MNKNFNHTEFEKQFFERTNIQFSKSQEDVWLEMDTMLGEPNGSKVLKMNFRKAFSYGAAATILLFIGIVSFLRFYSIDVYCPKGQHSTISLPDNSEVTLNANSKLSYFPYWWKFSRQIEFEGEAYFNVAKGTKFEVISEYGKTTVLGTSFNIFARDKNYKVHCISGKVKVEVGNDNPLVLAKNEFSIKEKGERLVKLKNQESTQNSISWISNKFVYTDTPLIDIIEEIERQFDIIVDGKERLKGMSTVSFTRGNSPNKIINIVSKPFGLKCIKISGKKYKLVKINE